MSVRGRAPLNDPFDTSIIASFDRGAAGSPDWGGTAGAARTPASKTSAQTDKWSPFTEASQAANSPSAATEPATSSRPSLDDGAVDSYRTSGPHAAAVFDATLAEGSARSGGGGDAGNGTGMARQGIGSGRSGGREEFGDEQPLAALFCVFDGHCGRLAAEQAAQLLPRELTDRIDPRQLLQVGPICCA